MGTATGVAKMHKDGEESDQTLATTRSKTLETSRNTMHEQEMLKAIKMIKTGDPTEDKNSPEAGINLHGGCPYNWRRAQ